MTFGCPLQAEPLTTTRGRTSRALRFPPPLYPHIRLTSEAHLDYSGHPNRPVSGSPSLAPGAVGIIG